MSASQVSIDQADPAGPVHHVLCVADYEVFDRFGRMPRHVALALNAEGMRVSLLTDDPAAVDDLAGTPIECHWVRYLAGWLAWRQGRQLSRLCEPLPDVIHLWGTRCLGLVGEWGLRQNRPVVVHVLSAGDVRRVTQHRWRERFTVAAASQGLIDLFAERHFAPSSDVRLAPLAILMPEPADAPPHVADRTLGLFWSGRIDEHAGLDTLIEAVALLCRKGVDLQAVLVGIGPGARDVRRRVREADVRNCVSLIEEPDFWERGLEGADVCVVPARQEELTLAPLLAMALGKPVIASRDQLAEWFVEDRTSWQFTPGSAVELAYHISSVIEKPRHASDLRRLAMEFVHEHHAISRLVRVLLRLYDRLVAP